MNQQSETEEYRGIPRKKNTKKWCKGKVGVEHKWEWHQWAVFRGFTYTDGYIGGFWVQVCTVCKKHGKFENRSKVL